MTPTEFCQRYKEHISALGVIEGSDVEQVEQTRTALTLSELDLVIGQFKVSP
jgi:chitin synthase